MLVQPVAVETVKGRIDADGVEPRDFLPAIAERGVEIAQAVRRGRHELARPAVEAEMRGERGLDAGERCATIGAQHLIAAGCGQPARGDSRFGKPIVGGIVVRIALPVALPRPAGGVGQLHILGERLGSAETQPPGLARQAKALHRGFVLIDQIGEAAERTDAGAIADEREDVAAADRLRPRARAAPAIHRAHAPAIGQVGAEAPRLAPLQPHRVIGLLVLPEARRTDEALVGELDTLASRGQREAILARIADLRAIEFEVRRVGDQRETGLAVGAVVIIISDRQIGLALDERRPVAFRRLHARANAQCQRFAIAGQPILPGRFVTKPRVEQRLYGHFLRASGAAEQRHRRCEPDFLHGRIPKILPAPAQSRSEKVLGEIRRGWRPVVRRAARRRDLRCPARRVRRSRAPCGHIPARTAAPPSPW